MRYCVYMHTTPNNKKYIGITFREPTKRWKNGNGYYNNKYFYNAIKKYGWNSIEHIVLFDNLTKEEAEKKEIELISFYNSANRKYGYNISLGGNENTNISNQTREKMRKSHLGVKTKPRPEYLKKQHSEFMKNKWKDEKEREKILTGLKKNHCIKVICVETNETFESYADASRKKQLKIQSIWDCCNGIRKTTGGYHWKKVGDKYA